MDIFDEKIIGYESVKASMRKIADVLKNTEKYKEAGALVPHGLLLLSPPGTGKTTLARALIEACGRKCVEFRKDADSNDFMDELKDAFAKAHEIAPSIILLEDIHSYSTSPYSSEWATLQAAIDNCGEEVFVVATTNDKRYMPPSLLRAGRFDYIFKLDLPRGKVADQIIAHYLKGKNLAPDVNIEDIRKALDSFSCATLETALNIAALNSVYDGTNQICKKHLVDAIMQIVYNMRKSDKEYTEEEVRRIALHEASHCVVCEVLHPGKTSVVSLLTDGEGTKGMADYYDNGYSTEQDLFDMVTVSLAGKAGIDLFYGEFDLGPSKDIESAYDLLVNWAVNCGAGGFVSVEFNNRATSDVSIREHELKISDKMDELYARAKKILNDNREFVLDLTEKLIEEETLFSSDIADLQR